MIEWMQTSDFFFGFMVLVMPFIVVMAYEHFRGRK
jgi:hypothetical protein